MKIFSGSQVEVLAIQRILELNEIDYITRDDIQSGVTAGFGTFDKAVHIFVDKEDYYKALKLIDNHDYYDEQAD